ncbi:O-antigen translocase [Dokdonia sp. Hel_I_53]|uniref:O-antigen translocase n=1 Tax=Dokdonia sp. Hel_I_53 TaxID=1566287 RepID=UPI00119A1459|nr:O-antigen translocase [Dokdonia sp. Hel_I_53]TVZ53431.1 PST family polysaccharide transporter [Dokdonia sp. Hel_I_53]
MLGKLRQSFASNVLLKVTSLNSIAVFIQIIGGLITSKLIAIYLGERGMALLGYLRNFLTSTQAVGSLGYTNGIVKYVASKEEDHLFRRLISTAIISSVFISVVLAIILYVGSDFWNDYIFDGEEGYSFVFKSLAVAIPFITINGILMAVINGQSAYKKVIWIQIATNLMAIAIAVYFIINFGIEGALQALIISPAIALLITLFIIGKESAILKKITFNFSSQAFKKLSSYTIMALFSMVVLPLVYIAIRNKIVEVDNLTQAGYWDAMSRISDYYLKFVATVMTLYILPQLAKTNSIQGFRKEIFTFYKTILPIFGIGLVIIFLARNFIIQLLFTQDFLPMENLFKWQLLGDFFKVASIVIGYQIIAKNNLKLFLITEIISLLVIYLSGMYFVNHYGYEGASISHCLSYFVHLLVLLFIFRKPLFGKITEARA